MLRQYGRLWSITGVVCLLLILLASVRSLQRSERTPFEVIEPQQETQDVKPVEDVAWEHTEVDVPVEEEEKAEHTDHPAPPPPPPPPPEPEPDTEQPSPDNTVENEAEDKSTPTETSPDEETPIPTETSKIIVMGKLSTEDTDWVGREMTDWQNAIYYVDLPTDTPSPSGLKTKMNKAKEVTPYLTYIIDHYDNLPDLMAFIHAHRSGLPAAWHNDAPQNDAVIMLRTLQLPTVLKRGYVNLRCNNEVGCPDEIHPFRDPPLADKHAEHAYPYVYASFFNTTFAEMRAAIPIVATQCCAQFAVSRAQVRAKPKSEYQRYLRFVEDTHLDDDTSGRVFEYMWHIIFGREAVHCENVMQCWCEVYGRCRGF